MDWQMPGLDGIETVQRLRSGTGQVQVPTIIMATAYGREEVLADAKALGIDTVLVKPVEASVLLNAILSALALGVGKERASVTPTESISAPHLRGAWALLAEDNEINQMIALELLQELGLAVDVADNGRQAVAMAVKAAAVGRNYDVILMDIQMPEMDGREATRHIIERLGATSPPIIAMTAHAMAAERRLCLDAGMVDHVVKPVDHGTLVAVLNRWLRPRSPDTVTAPVADRVIAPVAIPFAGPVTAPVAGALPAALPPFDLGLALNRLGGNAPLLRRGIASFHRQFQDTAAELERLIAVGAGSDARRLVHTIKGLAGTLGAVALADAAEALEPALADDYSDAERRSRLRDRLGEALGEALAAAGILAAQDKAAQDKAEAASASGSGNLPAALILVGELRTLLGTNSTAARSRLPALRAALAGCELDHHLAALSARLDRFDFRGAEAVLSVLSDDMAHASPIPPIPPTSVSQENPT
jgi:hypothetical protein